MFSEEFQKIVEFRRSNRAYNSEIDVEDEVIEKSIKRAILAPNSSNLQLWEFHWIKSQKELDKLTPLCLNQSAAKTAKHMV
ncbi:MAG: nitroreductase family protein, partial [Crocinitomicaceae bacterium]|nr:nitroreductase family protein [Crocinitomicaceae bacterium]